MNRTLKKKVVVSGSLKNTIYVVRHGLINKHMLRESKQSPIQAELGESPPLPEQRAGMVCGVRTAELKSICTSTKHAPKHMHRHTSDCVLLGNRSHKISLKQNEQKKVLHSSATYVYNMRMNKKPQTSERKPMNKKPINLTLHPRLVERARPVAESQGLSLSSWIGLLIYNALAEYHKANPKKGARTNER